MSYSKTQIANIALTRVGASPITSLDDDTKNARTVNRVYESALRSILSECKWSFATKRLLLSTSGDTLAWYDTGNTYVYVKPTDVVRVFETNSATAEWRIEGDYIISDTSGLGIRYVYYLDQPTKYPSYFVEAFIDKLCSDIAYTIVNSQTLGEKFKTLYEDVSLYKAMSINSQTGTQQSMRDTAWELAKFNDTQSEA